MAKKINTALISVYHKDGLEEILQVLKELNVKLLSTGGTQEFIQSLGYECETVEDVTGYPPILGGRVKTLHPKIFGGILYRRDSEADRKLLKAYDIPSIDLVIVDLYPFEETVANGGSEEEIIEKIDIGGISLIRAAAKNYKDVLVVASKQHYESLLQLLKEKQGDSDLEDRRWFAKEAFAVSSQYDAAIFNYFDKENFSALRLAINGSKKLRYGENPHQRGVFFGNFGDMFEQLHGKEISYNNLLDIDAAVALIADFDETSVAILKHNNACGMASRPTVREAWEAALQADPVSAYGGIVITNRPVDKEAAKLINSIFFEVIIAPEYEKEAFEILSQKKNRIILVQKATHETIAPLQYRSALNGILMQDKDTKVELADNLKVVTKKAPSSGEIDDLIFANKVVKHTKSNAIVLAKKQAIVGKRNRADFKGGCIETGYRESQVVQFRFEGSSYGFGCIFPIPRLRGNCAW